MAAATVTQKRQEQVFGGRRYVGASSIVFANNGDTWDTNLNSIDAILLTPTTNVAFGFTVSGGGILTLVCATGLTFRGGVLGNF